MRRLGKAWFVRGEFGQETLSIHADDFSAPLANAMLHIAQRGIGKFAPENCLKVFVVTQFDQSIRMRTHAYSPLFPPFRDGTEYAKT